MAGHASPGYSDDDGGLLSDINVTPLVDVVLVLLIVFMITVPAIVGNAPIRVDLPESSAIAMQAERVTIQLSLRREPGGVALYMNEEPTSVDELADFLQAADLQPISQQPVSLSADKGIPYGEVTRILDILASLHITKITLQTRHVGPR